MRQIKLLDLELTNFKGQAHIQLAFQGCNASICGDNATGKTTIYDAVTWLLFGKDSLGNANFELKPLDESGQVRDHSAVTSVQAAFEAPDQTVSFRKEYYERWSTQRGSIEKRFDGNTCDYYVDGVPCKKYEYEKQVGNLVDEATFRMLTSVGYFCGQLPWQERRAHLFSAFGALAEREVLCSDAQFAPLLMEMGSHDLAGFRKMLISQRKGFAKTAWALPIRLDECQKSIQEFSRIDFSSLRQEREKKAAERDKLTGQLRELDNRSMLDTKRNALGMVENALAKLEQENRAFRQEQECARGDGGARTRLERDERVKTMAALQKEAEAEEAAIRSAEQEIERCREQWKSVNRERIGDVVCPTCGQSLPKEMREEAAQNFLQKKKERLSEIERLAARYKGTLTAAQQRLERSRERLAESEKRIGALNARLAAEENAGLVPVKDMGDYGWKRKELVDMQAGLTKEIEVLSNDAERVRGPLQEQVTALSEEIAKLDAGIAKEGVLRFAKARMDELRAEAREAEKNLDRLDRLLFLCEKFTRYQARFVEESVNRHFEKVRFRLFKEQINGGLAECCDATVDGVPYGSLNNGCRVNAGLDVIKAFSGAWDVSVPLFIDNAESVTEFLYIDTQFIRLMVSGADKELKVVYEN